MESELLARLVGSNCGSPNGQSSVWSWFSLSPCLGGDWRRITV